MRKICEVCKDKDSCSYIKQGKVGDCIDVQTSDYGYDEALEDGMKVYCRLRCNEDTRQMCTLNPGMRCLTYKVFEQEMQELYEQK